MGRNSNNQWGYSYWNRQYAPGAASYKAGVVTLEWEELDPDLVGLGVEAKDNVILRLYKRGKMKPSKIIVCKGNEKFSEDLSVYNAYSSHVSYRDITPMDLEGGWSIEWDGIWYYYGRRDFSSPTPSYAHNYSSEASSQVSSEASSSKENSDRAKLKRLGKNNYVLV